MKKCIIFLMLALGAFQYSGFSQSMGKGKNVFYIGVGGGHGFIGAGKYRGIGYTYGSTPTLHLGFEHGISEAIPQSIIGLGGHFLVWGGRQSYRDNWGDGWNKTWTDFTALFRGIYHHKFLVGEKWDVYASVMAGIKYRMYTYTYTDPYYANTYASEAGIYPATGISLGGRYYVSKTFGFYAEISQGYNVDYAQIGFAFKF